MKCNGTVAFLLHFSNKTRELYNLVVVLVQVITDVKIKIKENETRRR